MAQHHDGHAWAARSTTIHAHRAREAATGQCGCCRACVCEPSCAGSQHHSRHAPAHGSSTDSAAAHPEPSRVRASRRESRCRPRSAHTPADRPQPPPSQVNSGEGSREFSETGGLLGQLSYLCTRCVGGVVCSVLFVSFTIVSYSFSGWGGRFLPESRMATYPGITDSEHTATVLCGVVGREYFCQTPQ